MDYLQAIILSIVEGLTEFLPISSTGHLILTSRILNIEQTEFVKSFEIIIQLGSICAVIFIYWNKILANKKIWKNILIAFIPTMFVGLFLYKIIKDVLIGNALITLLALFIGGIVLIILEIFHKEKDSHLDNIENLSIRNALLIGVFQSVSVIPGVSRAGATIIGAMLVGTKRKTAVEFSFLLAIPTILSATVLDITRNNFSFTLNEYSILLTGLIGSFVVARFAVKFLLRFIQNHTFIPFGIYRILLSIIFALFIL